MDMYRQLDFHFGRGGHNNIWCTEERTLLLSLLLTSMLSLFSPPRSFYASERSPVSICEIILSTQNVMFMPLCILRCPLCERLVYYHSIFTRSFFLLFTLSHKFIEKVWRITVGFPECPVKNDSQLQKLDGDQIHLVTMISRVGGDASHGSHRTATPMESPHQLA